ncbi:hypothetical protein M885DRAFT_514925 [Pelagophyceae sp. CCMP2097]|nr:hypothetical protein M885DRAFT_514925 [Pelagophyceae sp. CCMP2097]
MVQRLRVVLAALLCASAGAVTKLAPSSAVVAALRRAHDAVAQHEAAVDAGDVVDTLGAKLGSISADSLKYFDANADLQLCQDDERAHLSDLVEARLELVYAKQLRLLRESCLARAKAAPAAEAGYELHSSIDDDFIAAAREASMPGSAWDCAAERTALGEALHQLCGQRKRSADAQCTAATQQANYLSLYRAYASQIQQLQQQQYSQSPPLNAAFNYRVAGTDINLAGGYQQGKASLQVTSVDDDTIISGDPVQIVAVPSVGNVGLSLNL